ncbi:MAG: DUF3256 family protein [Muribaculaceae bacterium]
MRFILLTLICFSSCVTFFGEAKTIRDLFKEEPDNILMILPTRTRLDMLDYFDSGQKVVTRNRISSDTPSSQLIDVTNDFIAIKLTESSEVAIKLFETASGKDTVLAVVRTALLPARDSRIAFYNTHWEQIIDKKFFTEPTLNDFIINKSDKNALATINEVVKFPIISYEIPTDDSFTLIAHLNLEQFLSAEDWEKVKPLLRPSIIYKRSGNNLKFKLQKQ